jgi:CheY-like chemotaxis protein
MTTMDMLEELGIAAVDVADGASALGLLESDGEIDTILTDLGLPGMSGHDLIAEVKKRKPSIRIVVASGYSSEQKEGALDGVTTLIKPFDLGQLRNALLG